MKYVKKNMNLFEADLVIQIGSELLRKMEKDFPNMKLGEPYKGKYRPFIIEYYNKFISPDIKHNIKDNLDEQINSELWQEISFIECFCKWLDEEKGILPKLSHKSNKVRK